MGISWLLNRADPPSVCTLLQRSPPGVSVIILHSPQDVTLSLLNNFSADRLAGLLEVFPDVEHATRQSMLSAFGCKGCRSAPETKADETNLDLCICSRKPLK